MTIHCQDQEYLTNTATSLTKVVAINFYGRSGTILMQSLLDGHPQVIVMPGTHFEFFYSFFSGNEGLGAYDLIDQFLLYFAPLFDTAQSFQPCLNTEYEKYADSLGFNRLGPNKDQSAVVDQSIFVAVMQKIFEDVQTQMVPRKFFIQSVYVAFHYASGRPGDLDKETYLLFPLHNQAADGLLEDFPNARYVVMTREPIDNTGSLFKYAPQAALRYLEHILCAGNAPVDNATLARAVRLEDLHSNPEKTTSAVSRWLGIPWHECMMHSTFQGMEWWGDNKVKPIHGFSPMRKASEHREVLWSVDKFRLRSLLYQKERHWHYSSNVGYGLLITRLAILPLLLIPLKIEFITHSQIRSQMIMNCLARLKTEGAMRSLKLIFWFCWLGMFGPWLEYRRLLLRVWYSLVTKKAMLPTMLLDIQD